MIVRVVQRDDGGFSVIRPVCEAFVTINEATERHRIGTAYDGDPALAGRPFVDVDETSLPAEPRSRWRILGGQLSVRPWWMVWR